MDGAIVLDSNVDPTKRLFPNGSSTMPSHLLTVGEVSRIFFGRDAYWIRRIEDRQMLNDESGKLVVRRGRRGDTVIDDRTQDPTMARAYSLGDVEIMLHTLAANGAISPAAQLDGLRVLAAVGRLWGLL